VLAQARPSLSGSELASLLVGSADPGGFALSAGGEGALDLGASLSGEVAASATTLGFGPAGPAGSSTTRTLTLANVSTRPLALELSTGNALVRVAPATLRLAVGASASISVTASAPSTRPAAPLTGVLAISPRGGSPLRVPWVIAPPTAPATLLRLARITPSVFAASDTKPALLRVQVGSLAGAPLGIQPVARLELRLYRQSGAYLGLLTSERDLLPGIYRFALTGRNAAGARLPAGAYALSLVAWPTLGGAPERLRVAFRIE